MRRAINTVKKYRFMRFASVGVVNTLTDFAILNLLILLFVKSSESTLIVLFNIFSAGCVAIVSFFLNKKYVFKIVEIDKQHLKILIFTGVTLTGLLLFQGLLFSLFLSVAHIIGSPILRLTQTLGIKIPSVIIETNIAKIFSTLGTMVWNYTFYKKLVFNTLMPYSEES